MSRKVRPRKKSLQPEALAALERAAVKAVELARRTGTPAYVLEGDKIVDVARRRAVKRKTKGLDPAPMSSSGFSQSSEAEQQILPPESSKWPLWPWLVLLGILVVVMVVRAGLAPAEGDDDEGPRGERHPAVGIALTRFQLEPLTGDGRPLTEADLTAAATLVNFWGPWCPACVVEFPHLVELEKHFRSQPGFQFISISTNFNPLDEQQLAENTAQFLKDQNADFPTYRDPKAQTTIELIKTAKIEDFGYPATLLLGPGGVIRGLWQGYYMGDEKKIRVAIEKALLEKDKKP